MMSDGEEDLELLRSAALASLGKKKIMVEDNDTDDLDALRQVALTSRKTRHNNEPDFFEKLQPAKSSNLINLTPDPGSAEPVKPQLKSQEASKGSSDSSDDENESDADESDSNSGSSSDKSSSSESTDEEEQEENIQSRPKVKKSRNNDELNDEDDLLDAIDQFLDEGVVMLEEAITPVKSNDKVQKKPKNTKIKQVKDEAKRKSSKRSTSSTKPKTAKVKSETNKEIKWEEHSKRIEKSSCFAEDNYEKVEPVSNRNNKSSQRAATERNNSRNYSNNWKSSDLPLTANRSQERRKTRRNKDIDIDSVHSSDLSFLTSASDSSDQPAKAKNSTENNKSDVGKPGRPEAKRKYIRVNKNKLDLINRQREVPRSTDERFRARTRTENHPTEFEKNDQLSEERRDDNAFPDLRDKLRHKGVKRRVGVQDHQRQDRFHEHKKSNQANDLPKIQVHKKNKIYMRPGVVYKTSDTDHSTGIHRSGLKEDSSSRLIITRNVSDNGFEPKTVRLADRDVDKERSDKSSKSFRRKRSVVQFMPDTPVEEKQKKLEIIKKQAEKEKQEANSFSDLSENFDDFEIGEPDDIPINVTVGLQKHQSEDEAIPDTRCIISASRPNSNGAKMTYDEDADSGPVKVRSSVRKRSRKASPAPNDPPHRDPPIKRRRRSGSVEDDGAIIEASFDSRRHRDGLNGGRIRGSVRWREAPPVNPRSNRYRDERLEERFNKPSSARDVDHFRRKRRVGVILKSSASSNQERHSDTLSSRIKPVRERLGHNRGKSPLEDDIKSSFKQSRERKRDLDENREKSRHEKDVDERIRRINKKNAEILERRRMIELEEKKFQLNSGPL